MAMLLVAETVERRRILPVRLSLIQMVGGISSLRDDTGDLLGSFRSPVSRPVLDCFRFLTIGIS